MNNGKDLVEHAIEYGQKKGAKYVEARHVKSFEESYTARNGLFLGILEKPSEGIGIRAIIDGSLAFGSTGSLEKQEIEKLVDTIIKMAKSTKRKDPITLSDEKFEETHWQTKIKQKFEDISREEKKNYLKTLDKTLKKEVGKKLKNRIAFLMLYDENRYTATNQGAKIEADNSLITMVFMNTARGEKSTEQRMNYFGATAGWEWLREYSIMKKIVDDAKSLMKTANNHRNMIFDKPIDVIVSGEVSGIMAHENVGHPSEGDRIKGREGAQAGESFYVDLLKDDKLGEVKLGNECVNILDDPTKEKLAGYYLYDDECVKARPRYLIKDGNLNDLLLNREYAARFNTKSTAAARTISYNREPIPRMANTFFEPGEFTVEEMVEDVKEGILMNSFTEWNIDDRRFQSKYVGLEAYLIKNGEISNTMIRRPVLELTTKGILGSVDAIANDFWPTIGLCGKNDPMTAAMVMIGGPHVRLRNINVGGS